MKHSTRITLLTACLLSIPVTSSAGPLRDVASAVGDAAGYVGETGVMLDADITGTKYWKSTELNSLK